MPSAPVTSTLSEIGSTGFDKAEVAALAKHQALDELRQLGGKAALRADELETLSTPKFIEQLAVRPPVGPSTIAAPRPGAPVPAPSVNWIGDKGGATTGHPGVALLLAQRDGMDTYDVRCTGTLISQNIILSAAHCVCYSTNPADNYPTGDMCIHGNQQTAPAALLAPSRWLVFLQHAGMRSVDKVEVNDQYEFTDTTVRSDIAILVLSKSVDEIDPPAMPQASETGLSWSNGLVVGFGYSAAPDTPTATIVQQLVFPGLKAQGQVFAAPCSPEKYLDPAGTLCSLYGKAHGNSQATICGGDSGGPLWELGSAYPEIGVTSGRNNDNCAMAGTLGFQMSLAFPPHSTWINERLARLAKPPVKGRWPAFGENLRFVRDRRNVQIFDDDGKYQSDGWITSGQGDLVLGTMNSSGKITSFELQDRAGKTLCRGAAGAARKIPNVDYCSTRMPQALQYRVVAEGTPHEYLQYVVTTHASGTSFQP